MIKIKILTSTGCSQCNIAKTLIKNKGCLYYEEIDVDSAEGLEIIEKHKVMNLPFFILNDNEPVFSIGELLKRF